MRRIVLWFAATATVVVLLFAYHTSTDHVAGGQSAPGVRVPAGPGAGGSSATTAPTTGTGPAPRRRRSHHRHPSSGGKSQSPTSSAPPPARTYAGPTVQTARGPVEVKVTVRAGKVVDVKVPVHPDGDPNSVQINDYALPQLIQETMSAQSANIDMVSGATLTSEGYAQSLQSALDKAGIH